MREAGTALLDLWSRFETWWHGPATNGEVIAVAVAIYFTVKARFDALTGTVRAIHRMIYRQMHGENPD